MDRHIAECGAVAGHPDISIVEIEGMGRVALGDWDGDVYSKCWLVEEVVYPKDREDSFALRPLWKEAYPGTFEILGYQVAY